MLSFSVASSVWDSGKLEVVIEFLRAVVLSTWSSTSSNVTCRFLDPTSDSRNGGVGGQHSVF